MLITSDAGLGDAVGTGVAFGGASGAYVMPVFFCCAGLAAFNAARPVASVAAVALASLYAAMSSAATPVSDRYWVLVK